MAEQLLIDLKNTVNEAIASENPEDFADQIFEILFDIDKELGNLRPKKINELEKSNLIEFLNESKKYPDEKFEYYLNDGGYSRLFLKTEPGKELNANMDRGNSKKTIVDKWIEMGAEEVFAYRYSELPKTETETKIR